MTSALGFKANVNDLHASLPAYNGFLRFTSGVRPADLFAASIAALVELKLQMWHSDVWAFILLSMNKPWFIIPTDYFTWKHHFSTIVCVLGYEGQPHARRGATETTAIPTKDWETSSKASYSCSGSSLRGMRNLISNIFAMCEFH